MRSCKLLQILLSVLILSGCAIHPAKKFDQKYSSSPIIGAWVYSVRGCDETYIFLPTGIRISTSKREISKAKYEIEAVSPERGIYKLRDEVLEDNGMEDCSGSTADMAGDVVEVYIVLSKNPDRFIYCFDKELKKCVGPFIKKEQKT